MAKGKERRAEMAKALSMERADTLAAEEAKVQRAQEAVRDSIESVHEEAVRLQDSRALTRTLTTRIRRRVGKGLGWFSVV